jgi:hypothetical protein
MTPDEAAAKITRFMGAFKETPIERAWRTVLAERDALCRDLAAARHELEQADHFGRGEFRVTTWAYEQATKALDASRAREAAARPVLDAARAYAERWGRWSTDNPMTEQEHADLGCSIFFAMDEYDRAALSASVEAGATEERRRAWAITDEGGTLIVDCDHCGEIGRTPAASPRAALRGAEAAAVRRTEWDRCAAIYDAHFCPSLAVAGAPAAEPAPLKDENG